MPESIRHVDVSNANAFDQMGFETMLVIRLRRACSGVSMCMVRKHLTLVILTHMAVTLLMISNEEDSEMLPWEYSLLGGTIRRDKHMPGGRGTGRKSPRTRAST